jgi:membrane-bound serine protease (ClpP class)
MNHPQLEFFHDLPTPGSLLVDGWGSIVPDVRQFASGIIAAALALLPVGQARAAEPMVVEKSGLAQVVIIPIRAQIAEPELYILRRGLKEAIDNKVDTIVLDMETPGGALDVTFEMLKALEKFPGRTVTYVNREAISAGALISAGTDEIYFAPEAVIGAAAPVLATGGEIDETMRGKIVSYLKARVRSISEGKGYRGEVISAMIDMESEFKIGEEIIKKKGELLSLTAHEAMKTYGDPPQALLGAGIAKNMDELLDQLHGAGNHSAIRLEVSWSEKIAQYLTALTPLLLAGGLLCLFIEFKTPGFGVFGVSGILLLGIVFFGHYIAGLTGFEPLLVFLLGLVLVVIEVFFFPGTLVMALSGAAMMFGSLVWAMLDLWPGEPVSLSGDILLRPLANVMTGIAIAVLLFIAMIRYLPGNGPWGGMVLEAAVGGEPSFSRPLNSTLTHSTSNDPLLGSSGISATALFPSGQIEIDGKRYEAKLAMGFAEAGTQVKVTGISEFGLIVEVIS